MNMLDPLEIELFEAREQGIRGLNNFMTLVRNQRETIEEAMDAAQERAQCLRQLEERCERDIRRIQWRRRISTIKEPNISRLGPRVDGDGND